MRRETLLSVCIPFCFNAFHSFGLVFSTVNSKAYAIHSFLVHDNMSSYITAVYLKVCQSRTKILRL